MEITKTKDKITFTFPRFEKRFNPYDPDRDYGNYPFFTGLIVREEEYEDMGFAGTIDMDYKGKPDQVSDFIVKWCGSKEDFRKECKKLGIRIYEMKVNVLKTNKQNIPMGVSQWRTYGKKWGYWEYFEKQHQQKIKDYHNKFINSVALGTAINSTDKKMVEFISGLFDRYIDGLLQEINK